MNLSHLVLFPVIFPIIPVIYPQISMTEINQGIFCTLFQCCKNFKIQLFPVISLIKLVIKIKFQWRKLIVKNFVLFFQITPIQLFSVIFVLLCLIDSGKLDKLNSSLPLWGRSRKMTGKSTKWERFKSSYYNYYKLSLSQKK